MKKIFLLYLLLFSVRAFAVSDYATSPTALFDQVYGSISGACTQDADADQLATTVDTDSASGQKTLKLTATTNLVTADVLVVNPGGAREEACIVNTVSAGDSVVCVDNLAYTHTAVQADVVHLTNRLPATGTTGFPVGLRYVIYCHDGAGTGKACEITQGTSTVDAQNKIGVTLFAGEKVTTVFRGTSTFLSVYPAANNTYVDVCPLR
jgi:hypothetical protein